MAAGCAKVFKDLRRPERPSCQSDTSARDWRRAGSDAARSAARSTRDLLNVLDEIGKRGSLKAAWATVLGGLAGFERELIRARTGEGLKRQRPRGQVRSTSEDDPASAPGGAAAPCCWRDYGRCGADLCCRL